MSRRYFDHMYNEICVAAEKRVSRYGLWLLVWEAGGDPDDLTQAQVRTFVGAQLDVLLREEGVRLAPRVRRRLERDLLGFDPHHPTPEEWMAGTIQRIAG
ncbi:MAG: hypothetical protein AAGC67_02780 [Myxococcota bacterium]